MLLLACGTSPGDSGLIQHGNQGTDTTASTGGTGTGDGSTTANTTEATDSSVSTEATGSSDSGETGETNESQGTTDLTTAGETDPSESDGTDTDTAGSQTETETETDAETETETETDDPPTETGNQGMGWGELAGDCGLIDGDEIDSPNYFVFTNSIDFGDSGFDYDALTPGGQKVYDDGNLGGSSLYSEVAAYEVLARCDMALLLKTEGEIVYQDEMGKKTDLLVDLAGHKVGVSVTRAFGFPPEDPYTVEQAENLLNDKLADIQLSTANVSPEDAWTKQILHVIAYADMHVQSIETAYAGIAEQVKADTIVVVSVTHGDDGFIYD